MKTNFLKIALLYVATIGFVSCSKEDDATVPKEPAIVVSPSFVIENATAVSIPDRIGANMPGIGESLITTNKVGLIKDTNKVTLEIDMSSTFIGELVVELIAPNGASTAILYKIGLSPENTNGASCNFKTGEKISFNAGFTSIIPFAGLTTIDFIPTGNYNIYAPNASSPSVPLDKLNVFFLNKSIEGTWKLKIYDCFSGDDNFLNSWKLKFEAGALK